MIVFFVGTSAELVKLAPVIRETKKRSAPIYVVASGQNELRGSDLWPLANVDGADLTLARPPTRATAAGLAIWLARTTANALPRMRKALRGATKGVVHGDTVSSLMGAALFRALGIPVHHVEAGLRSFRMREPFPEEICRILVSRVADVAYCPNQWAADHLDDRALRKVITGGNTLYDAMHLALGSDAADEQTLSSLPDRYFVLVVHRQENLATTGFLSEVLRAVRRVEGRPTCLLVLHTLTKNALVRAGLLEELERDPTFHLLPRQSYVTFTRILDRAEFLVTDGGSNQEESFYMGKPCLLMRKVTERIEGLGENVVLAKDPVREIEGFVRGHRTWARPRVMLAESPSASIATDLASR